MNVKKEITMTWEDAPDTITPEIYAQIRGIGTKNARNIFNRKDFPRLDSGGNKQLADKTAVRLYDMGISTKTNAKQGIDFLIFMELQKISRGLVNKDNTKEELKNVMLC